MHSVFFNAHHSPIGSFSTLTLGEKGAKGGLGIALKGPADENVFVGVEEPNRPKHYHALPFFDTSHSGEVVDYDVEGLADSTFDQTIAPYRDEAVSRSFGAAVDEWSAGDLTFTIFSPVLSIPDPETATEEELKRALAPFIVAELTIDNREGATPRKAFFGYTGSDRYANMRTWSEGGLVGIGQGRAIAIATDDPGAYAGIAFQPEGVLDPRHMQNLNNMLGGNSLIVAEVPARQVKTIRFCICFFDDNVVTTGLNARYMYTRHFSRVEDVAAYGFETFDDSKASAEALDRRLEEELGEERRFHVSHAIRSYAGSTECLELLEGTPVWVVNEGEYRMMNTFDLTVDQLFFELALNPWTVRNVLDLFVHRYSYVDRVQFPNSSETYPGGLTFTHDMGVGNAFAIEHFSCYEQAGLRGVFSYMSCEELVNWILCAALYARHAGDEGWVTGKKEIFEAVLESLVNRDHPDPAARNGVMSLDSSRCSGGAEITTYDSLDPSLGQARNNVYLAVKTWASYLLLAPIFDSFGDTRSAQTSRVQAERCAETIVSAAGPNGVLPAIIGEGNDAKVIPAIEGLIFPYIVGDEIRHSCEESFGTLIATLRRHFEAILEPGVCLFPDGAWRLSSTSRNSWLSKIYLCQFVSEFVFGMEADKAADVAHMNWLLDPDNSYYAWSDQMVQGKAAGSRYYPRGVTSALWLAKDGADPIQAIRRVIAGLPTLVEA